MELTFNEIMAMEPRLAECVTLAHKYAGDPGTCKWYREIKARFKYLVGWLSKHPDERLHTCDAYSEVYRHLLDIYENTAKENTVEKSVEQTVADVVSVLRVPFGSEIGYDGDGECPDCGVGIGELHQAGCDQEACAYCQSQRISCSCRAPSRPVGPELVRFRLGESSLGGQLEGIARVLEAMAPDLMPGNSVVVLGLVHELRDLVADDERHVLEPVFRGVM